MKLALRKSSTTEDDQNAGDATDTEQHDSLPEDPVVSRQTVRKPRPSWGGFEFKDIANKALQSKRNSDSSAKGKEGTVERKPTGHNPLQKKSSELSETSTSKREDSDSSLWSENIPMITISKTESAENIINEDKHEDDKKRNIGDRFQPKIRCVLRKQSTEIDEDTIRYFNNELERNISEREAVKKLVEADIGHCSTQDDCRTFADVFEDVDSFTEPSKADETATDKSSSDDTENKNGSVETILNFTCDVEPDD